AEEVREALVVGSQTPIVFCDARVRESAKATLIELVQHALARASAALRTGRPGAEGSAGPGSGPDPFSHRSSMSPSHSPPM
ncbi:MAG TPA: ATP/GTP-binding protein, partial [Actinomycetes bacterium]|nr:ATP/GTP-binding protein [Actinomycetes bacterium]